MNVSISQYEEAGKLSGFSFVTEDIVKFEYHLYYRFVSPEDNTAENYTRGFVFRGVSLRNNSATPIILIDTICTARAKAKIPRFPPLSERSIFLHVIAAFNRALISAEGIKKPVKRCL